MTEGVYRAGATVPHGDEGDGRAVVSVVGSTRRQLRALDAIPQPAPPRQHDQVSLWDEVQRLRLMVTVLGEAVAFFAGARPQPPQLMEFLRIQVGEGRDLEVVCETLRANGVAADASAYREWDGFSRARRLIAEPPPRPLRHRGRNPRTR
jgi:hypothetical protein